MSGGIGGGQGGGVGGLSAENTRKHYDILTLFIVL